MSLDPIATAPTSESLLIEKSVYGGNSLARQPWGEVVFVPFVLPGERVERTPDRAGLEGVQVLEPSPDRVQPRCVHFGTCGGCQYQMASYPAQLAIKTDILSESLRRAGLGSLPEVEVLASPEAWGYRNRIRLRIRELDSVLQVGYNVRGTDIFLPIRMCPIAAPVLWRCAEALLELGKSQKEAKAWLSAAAEVELLCDAAEQTVQIHLLCPAAVPTVKGALDRFAEAFRAKLGIKATLAASSLHAASGRPGKLRSLSGPEGLAYLVGQQSFWLRPGSFFQVNRFLIPAMVSLVHGRRTGKLAWDLFAGAGLFSRALAASFAHVTAVEANPVALQELARGLRPGSDDARSETVLGFLRAAPVQRDRPEVVVLDPPRAGAGEEACNLLLQLQPREVLYVSCDPTTLARDASILVGGGYHVAELHMVDLFPQTYHLETVMVLRRSASET